MTLAELHDAETAYRGRRELFASRAPVRLTSEGAPYGSLDDVQRRAFLAAAGTMAGAALFTSKVFARPDDVPPELAEHFAGRLREHVRADTRLGAGPLLNTVISEHRSLCHAADVAPQALRGELLHVAAGYADVAAWLHQDIGLLDEASLWCNEVLELAHRMGSDELVASALASKAFVQVDADKSAAAADLADAALRSTGPASHVYVTWCAAHAYSLAGRAEDVDRSLDGLANGDHKAARAAWWWAGTSSIERTTAICYGRLGRNEPAVEIWERLLDDPAPGRRNRGNALARYAGVLHDLEGQDAALTPTIEAVECLRESGSARLRHELVRLRDRTTRGSDLYEVLAAVA